VQLQATGGNIRCTGDRLIFPASLPRCTSRNTSLLPSVACNSPRCSPILSHRRTQPLAASHRPRALSSSTPATIQQEQSAGQGRRPARHHPWSCSPNSCRPRCCSSLVTSTEGQRSSLLGTGGCWLCFDTDKVDAHKRILALRASTSLTSYRPSSTRHGQQKKHIVGSTQGIISFL
jgi:hypothetical protein